MSTDEQANEGHSPDAQRTIITDFCHSRGWTFVGEYQDAGISGKYDDRPALQQLLDDARYGKFDLVVVHAVDRFYRNLQGLLRALDRLNAAGVGFVSITENLDFTTPWGKLTLAVLGTLAEIYIDKRSAETSKGKRARAQKGLWLGSIPLGYCKGNCSDCTDSNGPGYCPRYGESDLCELEPDLSLWLHPIESVAVRLAFEWYASGKYSYGDIAARLNEHEHYLEGGEVTRFRTKGRPGRSEPGPFCKESVRSLLKRTFYTGVVAYYGVSENGRKLKKPVAVYPGRHPAIIDQKTFERCQGIRRALGKAARKRKTGRKPRVYLRSGLLRCGQCGGVMRAFSTVRGYRYYRCATRIEHRGDCAQKTVQADEIEPQVVELLRGVGLRADWMDWMLAQKSPPHELSQQAAERARLLDRLQRILELYLAGDIDRERYNLEQAQCKQHLVELTDHTATSIQSAARLFTMAEEEWAGLTRLKQKSLLQLSLARATLVGEQLKAIQPTSTTYPLIQMALRRGTDAVCHSGSDGSRQLTRINSVLFVPDYTVS